MSFVLWELVQLVKWFRQDVRGGPGITGVHMPRETDMTGGWSRSGRVRIGAPSLKAMWDRLPSHFPLPRCKCGSVPFSPAARPGQAVAVQCCFSSPGTRGLCLGGLAEALLISS